ncbi:MAG: T9SS type A sorting domain-containing protein [Bacteroidales bacterium]
MESNLRIFSCSVFSLIMIFFISGFAEAQDTLHVESHIFVPQEETFEIQAGTVVFFHGYYHIWVEGTLLANGTEEQPILFTAADTTLLYDTHVAEGGWMGLYFFAQEETRTNATSELKHCIFEYAKSSKFDLQSGGAVNITGPIYVNIENCVFRHNYAYQRGGAIYIEGNNSRVNRSLFFNNTAMNTEQELWTYGGAIYLTAGRPEISRNRFEENYASGIGGALAVETADPYVFNNVIHNNNSPLGGGIGVLRSDGANVFSNNLITNNYSEFFGGGIAFIEASAIIANHTILNNYAAYGGGLYFNEISNPRFYNSIVRENLVHTGSNQVFIWDSQSAPEFYNCNMEGGFDAFDGGAVGEGFLGVYQDNIDEDPLFADPQNMNFSLLPQSPSVDSGYDNPDSPDIFPEDLAENPRFSGPAIDMGAFEFQYNYYNLLISIEGMGETDPGTGEHSHYEGATLFVTANPHENWRFDHWVTPWGESQEDTLQIEILDDMEITAVFEPETGLHPDEFKFWQVYPNPVKNFLRIKSPAEQLTPAVITLKTLCGTHLFQANTDQRNFIIPFNFEQLASGIYLIVIETNDYREIFRIINP